MRNLLPHRATSRQLTPTMWLVSYRGADYTVSLKGDDAIIKRRGSCGTLAVIPIRDYGKEEAIEWIERQF
jgi:hypothetical protein